jgi:hypothetical protein
MHRGAWETAAALARRIASVPDIAIRVRYLRHMLATGEPGLLVNVVAVALAKAEGKHRTFGDLMLAITLAAYELTAERRHTLAQAAEQNGHVTVARVLAPGGGYAGPAEPEKAPTERGRVLTLGERKALARRADRRLLARALRDPHPDVIRIVLGNPSLKEDDVIRLCAQRPIRSDVLREVFRHARWVVRPRVRYTLVRNPNTPLEISLQLVPHLNSVQAREVADSNELPLELRAACRGEMGTGTLH